MVPFLRRHAPLLALVLLLMLPAVFPVYWTMVLTEIFIMSLFAMSFNLLFGYTGLLSFGQGGFFGVGAYGAALVLVHGPSSLILAFLAGTGAAAVAALIIGFLSVRRDEIFFAILTLGFGMMLFTLAHNWRGLTGGSDGMAVFNIPPLSLGGWETTLFQPATMYRFTLLVVALGVALLHRVVRSPFGLMLVAARENRDRLAFAGGNVRRFRLVAFVIAGTLAGLSGVLFCLFNQMATPDIMHWSFSAHPVLMTVLGGAQVFWGPAFGAAVFFLLEQLITHFTTNWMIFLGAVLIPVVLFFPRGLLGTLIAGYNRWRTGTGGGHE
jgi:branched-chain amino acid transport system permease protein